MLNGRTRDDDADAKLVERIRDERWSWVNEPRVEPVEKEGIASSDLIKVRPRMIQIQIQILIPRSS